MIVLIVEIGLQNIVGKLNKDGLSFFILYGIINIGDKMRIAVDKNSYQVVKEDGNTYIYLYEDEPLEDLMKTKLRCVEYYECDGVDINLTDYNVDCRKRAKITDEDWDVIPPYKQYKIGIIIPNFNYSECLDECFNSLMKQTYQNFEVIFVDDMSTDNSVKKVKEYQKQMPNKIKIIELKQKRYNGGARNEGYLHLSDDVDYVYYIDSDDWLCNFKALEMINEKLQSYPDVLFVGMCSYKFNKLRICFIPDYKDKYEALAGWSGSCGKVIKKELATRQECLYNEGTLKEDKNQHCKICIYMENFALLKKPIYCWNQMNNNSVTTVRTKNPMWETSTIRHYADTLQLYLTVKGKDKKIDEFLQARLERTKKEIDEGGDRQW